MDSSEKDGAAATSRDAGNRTALVTGASSGIGAAIARSFGAEGWTVALGARRLERLEQVAAEVEAAGGRSFAAPLDVSRPDSIDTFFASAEAALGSFDLVVNNAAAAIAGLLAELDSDEVRTDIETNLIGPILISRRALPAMIERRRGDIVFISSANAVRPRPFQVPYTASKSGLEAAAKSLRMELEGSGVRAITVRPGPTMTEFAIN